MKRKYISLVMLLVLAGLFMIQSCTKDETSAPKTYLAAMPANPVPGDAAVLPFTGPSTTVSLKWDGTATNAISWDVYFGTSAKPAKVATGVTSNAYEATVTAGGTYYWKVVTTDANNITTTSPTWSVVVNSNPGVPAISAPANNATAVSCTPTIKWTADDPEGDALTYDLYIGKTSTPALAYSDIEDPEYAIATSLAENTDYYWKVVAKDPYGGTSESPVWKFTTGLEPINTFTGNYTADEPAEAYSYDVAFKKKNSTTVTIDNYWNSTWVVDFKLDLTNLTYTFPVTTFQSGWTGTETGIIDKTTGTMTGTYTIWHNGAIAEQGVHTYTKK